MEQQLLSQLASFLMDKPIMDEIRKRVGSGRELPKSKEWNIEPKNISALLEDKALAPNSFKAMPYTEAIILQFGRPALLVTNDGFEIPEADVWKGRLYPTKSKIEKTVKSVGRIELHDHPSFEWIGTGWMIAEDIIITNRHVAMEFAEKKGQEFVFSHNLFGIQAGYIVRGGRPKSDFYRGYEQRAS
jgi:hypothetical protein